MEHGAANNLEALAVSASMATSTSARDAWDWQIYDEVGRLVWSSDLARRYRRETMPRKAASSNSARGVRPYDRLQPTPVMRGGETD